MHKVPFSSSTFPTATCEACGTVVLTHLAVVGDGKIARFCVRCDGPVKTEIAWLSAGELEQNGYEVLAADRTARARGSFGVRGCGGGCACSTKTKTA